MHSPSADVIRRVFTEKTRQESPFLPPLLEVLISSFPPGVICFVQYIPLGRSAYHENIFLVRKERTLGWCTCNGDEECAGCISS